MTFNFKCPFFREFMLFNFLFQTLKKGELNQAEAIMILQANLQFQFIHLPFI